MSQVTTLALYHYMSCPFCAITRRVLNNTDVEVEQRDIQRNHQYRSELIKGGGKAQVPCLRIEAADGTVNWLYESGDIINYLRKSEAA